MTFRKKVKVRDVSILSNFHVIILQCILAYIMECFNTTWRHFAEILLRQPIEYPRQTLVNQLVSNYERRHR